MHAGQTKVWITLATCVIVAGCGRADRATAEDISTAWRRPADRQPDRPVAYRSSSSSGTPGFLPSKAPVTDEPLLARVEGRPISRRQVVELLMRSQGATVLDQLVSLELAEAKAAKEGISITEADVEAETDRALRRFADPLPTLTHGNLDRDAAEWLLDALLAQRNLSRDVFQIVMRRNALLRNIVMAQLAPTDADLRREYDRVYGERVEVRHIQLASLAEVTRITERVAAGEDFAELARRYSANRISAEEGGLLEPFSRNQEEVPRAFREAAFSLDPGQVSHAVRTGEWYHLIKLEKRIPTADPDFAGVQSDLARRWRERVCDKAMFDLYQRLLREAKIQIYDPAVRDAFNREHEGVAR